MEPRDQRTKFYDALFRECSEAQINVRAIHKTKDEYTVSDFIPLGGDSIDQMKAFVDRYDTEPYIGVYHAVATRNGGGKKEHIVEIPALWIEIDFKNTPEEEARKKLGEFHFAPSAVISSGGGLHAYWFLKEPATKVDIPEVEDTLRRLVKALDAEPQATDASRILRIPGTYNRKKDYDSPREVKLIYCHPEKRYNFQDIADFLPEAPDDTPEPMPCTEHGSDVDRVMQCKFMQHCDEDRSELPEPQWYCMISNLARCQGGPSKIHELSVGYPGYSRNETNGKILHAIDAANPHTCKYIRRLWDCGTDCGVKAPAVLARKEGKTVTFEPLTEMETCINSFLTEPPPPRTYYFENLIPRGIVGNISARGGSSKGFLLLTLGMGLATGEKVLGYFRPEQPTKILALFSEETEDELHRRIHFTADTLFPDMGEGTRQLLTENFHAKSVIGMVGGLMELYEGNPVPGPKYDWLVKTIEAHEGLELLLLDPKSRFYGLDELNNDHNTAWLICLENLRNKYGIDVIFTHHVSQSQGDRLTQTAARGGTALIDGVRWAANLRTLTEKDGKTFDLEDHRRYIEFDVTKSNYAPMLPQSLYFKREAEGVLLPVDLRQTRLQQIADEIKRLYHEMQLSDGAMLTKRELVQRKEGAELRDRVKEAIPSCTNKDIAQAIDRALKENWAELVPDPKNAKRKLLKVHVKDTQ
jgi:replicative DNA helicase